VVLPDEQYLAATPALYLQLMNWIANNVGSKAPDGDRWNTIGAISVGDCADVAGLNENSGQCAVVKSAYKVLDDAGIPFIAPPGNHDYLNGSLLSQRRLGPNFAPGGFFSPAVRALRAGYGGSYDEDTGVPRAYATGANSWVTLSTGSRRILVIALEFCPRDAVLSWAKQVQDSMPDAECVVTTHSYLTDTGVQGTRSIYYGPQTYNIGAGSPLDPVNPALGLSGEEMWGAAGNNSANNPLKFWPNLTAVLSGHYIYSPTTANSHHYNRTGVRSLSPRGQLVQQFHCNAQDLDYNGDGNGADLCILRFVPVNGVLSTYWISTRSGKWSGDSIAFSGAAVPLETGVLWGGAPTGVSVPAISAVVRGGSFTPGFSQASWISIFGTDLCDTAARSWRADEIVNGSLPTALDNVRVLVNGKAAAISYISLSQVNALAPADDFTGPVAITVMVNGRRSNQFYAELQQYAPAFFQWPGGSAVTTDTQFRPIGRPDDVAGARPAVPGETVILWATGLGMTVPRTPADRVAPVAAQVVETVFVLLGEGDGTFAIMADAAVAPGWAGLYQVSVRLPDSGLSGAVPVRLAIGAAESIPATLVVGDRKVAVVH
jgi:uncharacterized protein (TIGR03437 family)